MTRQEQEIESPAAVVECDTLADVTGRSGAPFSALNANNFLIIRHTKTKICILATVSQQRVP